VLEQRADLEVNEAADGLVVYDPEQERVHHLNRSASLVFELCTGENSEDTIVELVGRAFGLDEPPAAEVRDCLASLTHEGLVR
jgi:hypothetical protein